MTGPATAPPNRLLYNEDGETLDEIVAVGTDIHVEQMDDHLYWMRVGESHFHFRAEPYIGTDDEDKEVVRVRIRFTLDDEAAGEFPLSQRHKTEAEVDARDKLAPDNFDWYVTLRGGAR